jgi:hypothetical protein
MHVLWFCMTCLWSDQFGFVALNIVLVVEICGVLQAPFSGVLFFFFLICM